MEAEKMMTLGASGVNMFNLYFSLGIVIYLCNKMRYL